MNMKRHKNSYNNNLTTQLQGKQSISKDVSQSSTCVGTIRKRIHKKVNSVKVAAVKLVTSAKIPAYIHYCNIVLLLFVIGCVTNDQPIGKLAKATANVIYHYRLPNDSMINKIVSYEGWNEDSVYIGYGHMRQKGDPIHLTTDQARRLVLKDLEVNWKVFRSYGCDSLALGLLAYNIGAYSLSMKSVLEAIKTNNKIDSTWLDLCHIGNKEYPNLKDRRKWELKIFWDARKKEK